MDKPKLEHLLIDPVAGGAFFTPVSALESIKKIMDATEVPMEPNKERGKNLVMPRGIVLQRYVSSDRSVKFVGQYRNTCCVTAGPASRPVRMYEINVAPRINSDGWYACIREEDKDIAYLDSMFSRNAVERMALDVLKGYLRYRDRRTARKALRRKRAKELKVESGELKVEGEVKDGYD